MNTQLDRSARGLCRATRLVVIASLAVAAAGCNRAHYRRQADREAYCLVERGSTDPRWPVEDFTIEPDPRSRFFDAHNPDRPPMPPDDPISHQLMRCVDGKQGWPYEECYGTTSFIENPDWEKYLPYGEDGTIVLNRQTAVEVALLHSREYQQELEDLYLSALEVTFQRFRFDAQFFGGNSTFFTTEGPLGGRAADSNTLSTRTDAQMTRLFATGGQLVVDFANSVVWEFSGADGYSSITPLNFSLIQPLLRGAGRAVVLEQLTDTERALLANIRQLERFRRGFYVEIIAGGTPGPGPSSRDGIGIGDVSPGGARDVGGYLSLLEQQLQIRNQRSNVAALRDNLERLEAFMETGQTSPDQVDQVRQSLYSSQIALLTRINRYEDQLDGYKITLGLPPQLELKVEDPLLEPFNLIDPDLTATQEQTALVLDPVRDIWARIRQAYESARAAERAAALAPLVAQAPDPAEAAEAAEKVATAVLEAAYAAKAAEAVRAARAARAAADATQAADNAVEAAEVGNHTDAAAAAADAAEAGAQAAEATRIADRAEAVAEAARTARAAAWIVRSSTEAADAAAEVGTAAAEAARAAQAGERLRAAAAADEAARAITQAAKAMANVLETAESVEAARATALAAAEAADRALQAAEAGDLAVAAREAGRIRQAATQAGEAATQAAIQTARVAAGATQAAAEAAKASQSGEHVVAIEAAARAVEAAVGAAQAAVEAVQAGPTRARNATAARVAEDAVAAAKAAAAAAARAAAEAAEPAVRAAARAAERAAAEVLPTLPQALAKAIDALAPLQQEAEGHLDQVRQDVRLLEEALSVRRGQLRQLSEREEFQRGDVDRAIADPRELDKRVVRLNMEFFGSKAPRVQKLADDLLSEQDLLRALPDVRGVANDLPVTLCQLELFRQVASQAAADAGSDLGAWLELLGQLRQLLIQLSEQLVALSLVQARARLDTVTLTPVELGPDEALEIARANRRDWMNARAALVDQWRQIEVAANDLLSDLDLTFAGDLTTRSDTLDPIHNTTGNLRLGFEFDAPLTRLAERNAYRQTLIAYQRTRRAYYAFEDQVSRALRDTIRSIRLGQLQFELERAAVDVAIRRVEQEQLKLQRPAKPGEAAIPLGPTAARDLREALNSLLDAQNSFLGAWLSYEALRLGLDFDLGTMELDDRGTWIDPGLIEGGRPDRPGVLEAIPPGPEMWPVPEFLPSPGEEIPGQGPATRDLPAAHDADLPTRPVALRRRET